MSRGKHQRHRRAQRLYHLEREVVELEAAVGRETRALAAARAQADKTRTARRRLRLETAHTDRMLAAAEQAAGRSEQAAAGAWRDICDALAELVRVGDELTTLRRRQRGQSVTEALEAAAAGGFRVDTSGLAHRSAPVGYRELAMRTRLHAEFRSARVIDMTGWVPDGLATPEQIAPYARATVTDHTRAALWAYAFPPWTGRPTGHDAAALRAELGATTTGAPELPTGEFPGSPRREPVIDRPWRHAPLVGEAGDAVDLTYWFHRTAWAQGWLDRELPIPHWLPAEHASSYPRAAALPEGVDLRLPFGVVCAVFEEPWELPATGSPDDVMHTALLFARGTTTGKIQTLDDHLLRIPVPRAELATPLELIEHLGASVEGLLFRADDTHHPCDEFAWCLRLRHPWGLPLGRIVVPARRSLTTWRAAVDNVLAGVCLSRWHPAPGHTPHLPNQSRGVGDPAQPGTDDADVRVLDIGATSPDRARIGDGRSVRRRAHFRSGTWRWQWVGPGRTHQRPTWVRDTTVRGTGTIGHQVYRLPRDVGT